MGRTYEKKSLSIAVALGAATVVTSTATSPNPPLGILLPLGIFFCREFLRCHTLESRACATGRSRFPIARCPYLLPTANRQIGNRKSEIAGLGYCCLGGRPGVIASGRGGAARAGGLPCYSKSH